jgi:hypothetical protein
LFGRDAVRVHRGPRRPGELPRWSIIAAFTSAGHDITVDTHARVVLALGGEAGNTHCDSVSHCVLVAVQTKNQMIAIDPVTEKIVQRYGPAGSAHPHGFTLDGSTLEPVGEVRAPHAHTVSVDPRTHRVDLPRENIDGKPLLRVYLPATDPRTPNARR